MAKIPINTTQAFLFDSAPVKIELRGDKKKKIEASTHIIQFPGGAIEVSRTSEGNYWAHIIINRAWADPDCEGVRHCYGEVINARSDPDQIAVLIKPTYTKPEEELDWQRELQHQWERDKAEITDEQEQS